MSQELSPLSPELPLPEEPERPRKGRRPVLPRGELDGVRRNLFGPVDHAKLDAWLLESKREHLAEKSRRWNFDFGNGTPASGRYEWSTSCEAPQYFREQ